MALNINSTRTLSADAIGDNPYVRSLINPTRWDTYLTTRTHNIINWSLENFATTRQLSAADAQSAFAVWSDVANIMFTQTTQPAQAEIRLHTATQAFLGGWGGGYSGTPSEAFQVDNETLQRGNWAATSVRIAELGQVHTYLADTNGNFQPATGTAAQIGMLTPSGREILMHEIGHALGLAHPHDTGSAGQSGIFLGVDGLLNGTPFDFDNDGFLFAPDGSRDGDDIARDPGDNNLNSTLSTIMSYQHNLVLPTAWGASTNFNGGAGAAPVRGPMAFDIAAIQTMYGANTTRNGGDDTYTMNDPGMVEGATWGCCWDAGGTDQIVYNGAANAVIDLRPATLDNSPTGGGMPSYTWRIDATGATVFGRLGTIAGDITNALADQGAETGVIIENATGGSGHDHITGNGADNVLRGNGGNDLIIGGAGRDTLSGGTGVNTIDGGAGDDIIEVVRQATDIVNGGTGVNTLSFAGADAGVTVNLAAGLARFSNGSVSVGSVSYSNIQNLTGSAFADTLTGDALANRLYGAGGPDTMAGGGGGDTYLWVDDVGDVVVENTNEGTDTVYTHRSGYTLGANVENLWIVNDTSWGGTLVGNGNGESNTITAQDNFFPLGSGPAARFELYGQGGSDTITGGDGRFGDLLDGGSQDDTLFGLTGPDVLRGGAGADRLDGGFGSDRADYTLALAGVVADLISGGSGGDALGDTYLSIEGINGSAFADRLSGSNDPDVLSGLGDADRIEGRRGNDTLTGGTGNDTLVFTTGWGQDTVTDFAVGQDRLDMTGVSGLTAMSQLSITTTVQGARIAYGADTITLTGVTAAQLTAASFGFAAPATPPTDDFAGNTGTTGQVASGGSATGNLGATADRDWFRVQLNAGTTYTIDLLGAETGSGTLIDPYLRVYNSAGNTVLAEDDDAGTGRNSQLAFTPGATGTYYIAAGAYDDAGTGTYRVTVSGATGNPTVPTLGDVLWRHTDGTLATADHQLGLVSNGWSVVGTGNTDGDADTDIVWRNQDTVVLWEMQNGQRLTHHSLASVGSSWSVAGLGDFDRDGDDDILWRNDDGRVLTWELEDNGLVRTHSLPSASNSWRVSGLGDFDGDGDDDIVWRHDQGAVVTWEMQNDGLRTTHSIASASSGWQIQGTGDFDRDGDDDLVWRNAEGRVTTWEMQDGAYVRNHNIESGGNSWSIYGVHDFDTDGDSDILWRNDNGTVLTWEMNGFGFVRTHNFGVVDSNWQLRGVGEFDLA
jgi:Ca2+-binding RTX toxin-like protein